MLAAAGLLFWHVRRNHGMLSGLRPMAIWLLETGMVALILFLLWHPALSVATLRPQQNVVAVLVDDSRSMAHRRCLRHARSRRQGGARQRAAESRSASRFQVRLYKFGKEPARIQKPDQLTATEPATRIGDTLERVLAESSSLPLGAIVLLSDGADNAGGIDLATIAAIRRQRIPDPHHRVRPRASGARRGDHRRRGAGARAAAIASSRRWSRFQSYGLSGSKTKLTVRDGGKVLASQEVTLKADGALQTESLVFNCGDAGPKTLEIARRPASPAKRTP